MAKNLMWFANIFEKIRIIDNRFQCLEEIQIAVNTVSQSDLIPMTKELPLGNIFDCLNTNNIEELQLAVSVLKKFLAVLKPHEVIKLHGVHLGRALEHPEIDCKKLVLCELKRAAQYQDLLQVISRETHLLISIIECVRNEDISLASVAINFLTELGKIELGAQTLFSAPVLTHLKEAFSTNDTVRYRLYDIIVDISNHSKSGLDVVTNSGLLMNLIEEIQSEDLLVMMSSLQSVTKLAVTDHGLQYLKDNQVLNFVYKNLKDNFNNILVPGYLKFFGNVSQVRPQEIFNEYPNLMNMVFQFINSDDLSISNVALETVGYIASSPEGKIALVKYDDDMKNVLTRLSQIILTQPTERKVIALNVLANIIRLRPKDHNSEILKITKKWFFMLGDKPMKVIKDTCEKPFEELKLAGLDFLGAIAEQPWGQHEINTCSGMIEYLLDRNEDSNMRCKTAKFEVLKSIYDSFCSHYIFPNETLDKFRAHVSQGIVYVQAKTEVAFEGAI